jgi:hypothetical protein
VLREAAACCCTRTAAAAVAKEKQLEKVQDELQQVRDVARCSSVLR